MQKRVPYTLISPSGKATTNCFPLSFTTSKNASPFKYTRRSSPANEVGKRNSESEFNHTFVPSASTYWNSPPAGTDKVWYASGCSLAIRSAGITRSPLCLVAAFSVSSCFKSIRSPLAKVNTVPTLCIDSESSTTATTSGKDLPSSPVHIQSPTTSTTTAAALPTAASTIRLNERLFPPLHLSAKAAAICSPYPSCSNCTNCRTPRKLLTSSKRSLLACSSPNQSSNSLFSSSVNSWPSIRAEINCAILSVLSILIKVTIYLITLVIIYILKVRKCITYFISICIFACS